MYIETHVACCWNLIRSDQLYPRPFQVEGSVIIRRGRISRNALNVTHSFLLFRHASQNQLWWYLVRCTSWKLCEENDWVSHWHAFFRLVRLSDPVVALDHPKKGAKIIIGFSNSAKPKVTSPVGRMVRNRRMHTLLGAWFLRYLQLTAGNFIPKVGNKDVTAGNVDSPGNMASVVTRSGNS